MIEQMQTPSHVVGMKLAGKISAADVEGIKPVLDKALAEHARIGVVIDVTGFEDASAEAIRADVKYEMGLMGKIGQFARAAFIADKEWLRTVTGFAGSLVPTMALGVFASGEEDKAIAWAGKVAEAPTIKGDALRMITTDREDVFGFEIDGVITPDNIRPFMDKFADDFGQPRQDLAARPRQEFGRHRSIGLRGERSRLDEACRGREGRALCDRRRAVTCH